MTKEHRTFDWQNDWFQFSTSAGVDLEGKPLRLFLRTDALGSIALVLSRVTSRAPGAIPLDDGEHAKILFEQDEVTWLARVLPAMVELTYGERPEPVLTPRGPQDPPSDRDVEAFGQWFKLLEPGAKLDVLQKLGVVPDSPRDWVPQSLRNTILRTISEMIDISEISE